MTKIFRMPAIAKVAQSPAEERRQGAPAMRLGMAPTVPVNSLFRRANSLFGQETLPDRIRRESARKGLNRLAVPAAGGVETGRNFAISLLFSLLPGNARSGRTQLVPQARA